MKRNKTCQHDSGELKSRNSLEPLINPSKIFYILLNVKSCIKN